MAKDFNPVYFHNRIRSSSPSQAASSDSPATTASLLAQAGYQVGDEVALRVDSPGTRYVILPNSRPATDTQRDGRIELDKDRSFQIPHIRVHLPKWSEEQALTMIDAYNGGHYLGRRNTHHPAIG